MNRRALLAIASFPTACALAKEGQASRVWIIGTWRSDREATMKNLHLVDRSIEPQHYDRVAQIFGSMTWRITDRTFELRNNGESLRYGYSILGETDSSITLGIFQQQPRISFPLTVYRSSSEQLFIKAGRNLEYYRRIEA